MLPPIVLFAYNRVDELRRVLDAIKAQTKLPDRLLVFSDAARDKASERKVITVRNLLRNIDWVDTEIIERSENLGCATNIINGLSTVFKSYDQAVILEDDVLPARHFYESMTLMLERYSAEEKVFAVGGYPSVSRTIAKYPYDVIMSPRFSCWGWGTWSERWNRIADDLKARKLPYSSSEEIPSHAGEDLPLSILHVKNRPEFYWDIPIALYCLRYNWFHAITNYYLTNNIGLTSGEHGCANSKSIQFIQKNNMIDEKVPRKLPEPAADLRVNSSIRAYLFAGNQAAATEDDYQTTANMKVRVIIQTQSLIKKTYRHIKRFIKGDPNPASQAKHKPDPKEYSTITGVGSVIPCQIEAYFLALKQYLDEGASVLDVGFGLGYGLNILAIKAKEVSGVDVDPKVYEYCQGTVEGRNPRLVDLRLYDGYSLDFPDNHFDIVTGVDMIEHVEDYEKLIVEMLRVSKKGVFLSTPNRRPEYTNPDGTPKNYWHLREWSYDEFNEIITKYGKVEWNFLNGAFDGPFTISNSLKHNTLVLSPFIFKNTAA